MSVDEEEDFLDNWDNLYKIINEKIFFFLNNEKFKFFASCLEIKKNDNRSIEMGGELTV